MIKIDGSYGEGGGQIVRTALALSVVTGKAIRVENIRAGRKKPGLKAQHLKAIELLTEMCGAEVSDVSLGSESFEFTPGKIVKRNLECDIGTAGSITLLLQSLWLPMIVDGGRFKLLLKGGTDVKWSMPMDYLKEVFVPQLRRFADVDVTIIRRGFYPKGQGEVEIVVRGKSVDKVKELDLTGQGKLMLIRGVSLASRELEKAEVAERMARAAESKLNSAGLRVPARVNVEYCESASVGCSLTLWGILSRDGDEVLLEDPLRIGGDSLGEKGKKEEVVGEEAASRLLSGLESEAIVDEWLGDNLIPLIGWFGGAMRVAKVSEHTKSNVYAVNSILGDKMEIEGNIVKNKA